MLGPQLESFIAWRECNNCIFPVLFYISLFSMHSDSRQFLMTLWLMQSDYSEKKKNKVVFVHAPVVHIWLQRLFMATGMSISLFTAERRGDKHFIMPKTVRANSRSFAGLYFVVLNWVNGLKRVNARCGNNPGSYCVSDAAADSREWCPRNENSLMA